MKPKAFIGSSTESLKIARVIQNNLEYDCLVRVWSQSVFEPSKSPLESLKDVLKDVDFAIFVFTPDDVVKSREKEYQSTRDNVISEYTLFVGQLGIERCFLVTPRGVPDLHLPSDFQGVTPVTFGSVSEDKDLDAALGPACNKIRMAIEKLGTLHHKSQATSSQAESNMVGGIEKESPEMPYQNVSLRAWNGQYVCAADTGEVLANRDKIDESAKFDLFNLGNNMIHIRAQNRYYLSAKGGGGDSVVASRREPAAFETFELYVLEGNNVALRSRKGQWVSAALKGQGNAVVATEEVQGRCETFTLIQHSET